MQAPLGTFKKGDRQLTIDRLEVKILSVDDAWVRVEPFSLPSTTCAWEAFWGNKMIVPYGNPTHGIHLFKNPYHPKAELPDKRELIVVVFGSSKFKIVRKEQSINGL